MGPKSKNQVPVCGVCSQNESKYRCSACPVRYCSVACYKQHKIQHEASTSTAELIPSGSSAYTYTSTSIPSEPPLDASSTSINDHGPEPITGYDGEDLTSSIEEALDEEAIGARKEEKEIEPGLKPLSSLLWPPEPDESIFTDPLKKEDPKPLRREELLRIATTSSLRTLLSTTSLPQILSILDTLPPNARHTTLSKLLGLDAVSLSKPGGTAASFLSGRESPPPLEELLYSFSKARDGDDDPVSDGHAEEGWWLRTYSANHHHYNRQSGQAGDHVEQEGEKIWIGPKEKEIVRLFARSVCAAIDGTQDSGASDPAWGSGGLEWQV
ncbi:hypothetical protein IAT40_004079 [Kwoniella sp. CBS 6097]